MADWSAYGKTHGSPGTIAIPQGKRMLEVKEDEEARQEYVDLLDVLGPESPEANSYRRKLASKLF